ncbi:IS3 family transposase [Tessaracoccus massiliensis]|uniref:IS3 family transposase n=1 Tax=Tessaracoccus massiliensis TaxID=1522311 RepID=UPI000B303A9F|nr:IS3 family transposase [Tessaracoccus massiliensis]
MVVEFIDDHRARFGVEPICRVLTQHGCKIAPSTYYAARARTPSARTVSDAVVWEHIEAVQADRAKGRGVAGYRKMWHLLKRDGVDVARCTVARLMREHGMQGVVRGRKKVITTQPDETASRPADLVGRNFTAAAPNRLWIVDFTYVPTWSGMVFTAFVTDVFSRRIVGWRTHHRMPTELPLDALEMALWVRGRAGHHVDGLIHHSDAGRQYTAIRYHQRLCEAGALASIGSVGDSYDNAMAESVIGLYKTECIKLDGPFKTVDEVELATLMWVDWYNTGRLHSAIGYCWRRSTRSSAVNSPPTVEPRSQRCLMARTRCGNWTSPSSRPPRAARGGSQDAGTGTRSMSIPGMSHPPGTSTTRSPRSSSPWLTTRPCSVTRWPMPARSMRSLVRCCPWSRS